MDNIACGGLRWQKHSAFLLFLLVLFSFSLSCSNKKTTESDSAKQAAREALELREAAASVLSRAFDEGRLGPKERVVAVMQTYAARFRPLNQALPKFFTDEGHLLPIRELNEDQRIAFDAWTNGPEIQAAIGPEITLARQAVRAKWQGNGK